MNERDVAWVAAIVAPGAALSMMIDWKVGAAFILIGSLSTLYYSRRSSTGKER